MRKFISHTLLLLCPLLSVAQKKPLDHTVYDIWQSIGEKLLCSNGKFVAYTVNPQEGDGVLLVQAATGGYKIEIPRGYNAKFTADNHFLVCKIKPLYKDTRDAKIKKRKADDMPKDSLAILQLGTDSLVKKAGIKSYKLPEKAAGWVAWLYEKGYSEEIKAKVPPDSLFVLNNLNHIADSLVRAADSLRNKVAQARSEGLKVLQAPKKEAKKTTTDPIEEGTHLVLYNLLTGEETVYPLVNSYLFSKTGGRLLVETTRRNSDTASKAKLLLVTLPFKSIDTVMAGFNDVKNYAFDEAGNQLAFVAERDSAAKALRKFYKLWYYTRGMDSAQLRGDVNTAGVAKGLTISGDFPLYFSDNGNRLLFGLASIRPVKDTTVPEFEKAQLDVWHYKDDDLQPFQLKNLEHDLKRSCLAVIARGSNNIVQLGSDVFTTVFATNHGDGDTYYALCDTGRRVARQWQGYAFTDAYAVNPATGEKKLVAKNFKGTIDTSVTGKYLLFYDEIKKGYWVYNSTTNKYYKIGADITTPLYDEENDVPDDPQPYGIAEWEKGDKYVYVYDRYDIWRVDPEGKEKSKILTVLPLAREIKIVIRYVKANQEERYINPNRVSYFRAYSELAKTAGYLGYTISTHELLHGGAFVFKRTSNGFVKADSADVVIYTAESFQASPDLFLTSPELEKALTDKFTKEAYTISMPAYIQLSHLNPQQSQYLWGTAELFKWKAYTGKPTEGILYKPENFDSTKKYPMIVYFYERNNNTLYSYIPPAPTPSRLNISFFVSRGYVVFVPDIWYTTGHPGKNAYDYIVSGTRALIKRGFIDSTKIGIQGQSWGGYQTAYVITQTNLYAAAWAGAPVVNMFSAYGGIRWETGINRQFQYEHTQSRIGATIWQRPDLYIENSPLFHLQKVKTPLVIMANDADGAVPWYQGIEFFTAMRRLNKPVWMLTYNNEAHNLVERRNRKDIQIREQQYFDWLLKGDTPPVWITDGVPAILKGIDAGLEVK